MAIFITLTEKYFDDGKWNYRPVTVNAAQIQLFRDGHIVFQDGSILVSETGEKIMTIINVMEK